jgi:hypothetical protein
MGSTSRYIVVYVHPEQCCLGIQRARSAAYRIQVRR